MKKYILSALVIITFGVYAIYLQVSGAVDQSAANTTHKALLPHNLEQ